MAIGPYGMFGITPLSQSELTDSEKIKVLLDDNAILKAEVERLKTPDKCLGCGEELTVGPYCDECMTAMVVTTLQDEIRDLHAENAALRAESYISNSSREHLLKHNSELHEAFRKALSILFNQDTDGKTVYRMIQPEDMVEVEEILRKVGVK